MSACPCEEPAPFFSQTVHGPRTIRPMPPPASSPSRTGAASRASSAITSAVAMDPPGGGRRPAIAPPPSQSPNRGTEPDEAPETAEMAGRAS